MSTNHIRNFSIVAHIDHGKSTLADRLLQKCGAVTEREFQEQLLDDMDLERERGITIKASAVTLRHTSEGVEYMLNLIDTPGHVDFHYEVSRSMAACEGALLVVDATQGVEAQTVANAHLAIEAGLEVIPVLNKIDLPAARIEEVSAELEQILGIRGGECFHVSAKSGLGVDELLDAIVMLLPPPEDKADEPAAALIFDSEFESYRGVICYVRVFSGELRVGQTVRLMGSGKTYRITDLGKLTPRETPVKRLGSGEVGFFAAHIRELAEVTIGDTVTDDDAPAANLLPGYKPPQQVVFSDFYPGAQTDFNALRDAFERLRLNDSSFTFSPQSSPALGFGFRCGFLGLLHMNIVQERLEREADLDVIQTAPTVGYEVVTTDGETVAVDSPSQMPERTQVETIREPIVLTEILTPAEFCGPVMKLAEDRRGELTKTEYLGPTRMILEYRFPLAEIVYDLYDLLKGATRGYATMDYEFVGFERGDLVKMDILVNKAPVDALSIVCHRSKARQRGMHLIKRLREEIPRRQFDVPLQAAIGSQIIARETIKAYRKDVTSKLYGGDVSRKQKVLKRQKEGKKRMKSVGNVEIPQSAFMAVLETGD